MSLGKYWKLFSATLSRSAAFCSGVPYLVRVILARLNEYSTLTWPTLESCLAGNPKTSNPKCRYYYGVTIEIIPVSNIYVTPECDSVEIGVQTYLNCHNSKNHTRSTVTIRVKSGAHWPRLFEGWIQINRYPVNKAKLKKNMFLVRIL